MNPIGILASRAHMRAFNSSLTKDFLTIRTGAIFPPSPMFPGYRLTYTMVSYLLTNFGMKFAASATINAVRVSSNANTAICEGKICGVLLGVRNA